MNKKQLILLWTILLFGAIVSAQDFTIPNLPTNKEEYVKSEPDIIAASIWLEKNTIGTKKEKTAEVNSYVMQWITKSPTVTVSISADFIVKLWDKNPQLLIVFIAGYIRYSIENNYSTDQLKCYTAGIKSALNNFALGGDIKKNKLLSKAIDADKEGNLEKWISAKMN